MTSTLAISGFSFNPYDPRRDPRDTQNDGRGVLNTGGSSSGTGTTANFWAANVGSETSGSILSPSNQNMLAGIKPTVGRISRYGVIAITADQDTAGPMAKSVTDAAIMLGALEGADELRPAVRVARVVDRVDADHEIPGAEHLGPPEGKREEHGVARRDVRGRDVCRIQGAVFRHVASARQ